MVQAICSLLGAVKTNVVHPIVATECMLINKIHIKIKTCLGAHIKISPAQFMHGPKPNALR